MIKFLTPKFSFVPIAIGILFAPCNTVAADITTTSSTQESPIGQPMVVHATTLPSPDDRFQKQLVLALERPSLALASEEYKSLGEWSAESGMDRMTIDQVIQQAFVACYAHSQDNMPTISLLILGFLHQLGIPPQCFATALTRYLDYPDWRASETALMMMDEEGVFRLPATSREICFPAVTVALQAEPIDPELLPKAFVEAMFDRDSIMAFKELDLLGGPYEMRSDGPDAQRQRYQADATIVENIVFALRNDTFPYDTPPDKSTISSIKLLADSKLWYSRFFVAYMLKNHPRYISQALLSALIHDKSKTVRDLVASYKPDIASTRPRKE